MIEETLSMLKAFQKVPAAIVAYVALASVVGVTMLAFGEFPLLFGGFERSSQSRQIAVQLTTKIAGLSKAERALKLAQTAHWAQETASSLLTLEGEKCRIPTVSGRYEYDKQIQREMMTYYKDTGTWYPLPRCSDL